MFYHYTGNVQFDLQINRVVSYFGNNSKVAADLQTILPHLDSIPAWNRLWKALAFKRKKSQDYDIASFYFFAAGFYLLEDNPDRELIQKERLACFYQWYDIFPYERHDVPFDDFYLPAVKLINPNAQKTLLVFAGYDSCLEELMVWVKDFRGTAYNIIIFDGPGQGNALFRGSHFMMNFERPVSAVLDYFELDRVVAWGISWGGYFVMRAAAFEKRIDKVIAMDIFYQGMDALIEGMPLLKGLALQMLLFLKRERTLNRLISREMTKNLDLSWKMTRGFQLTNTKTPFALLENLSRHSMKGLGGSINQEVLLLAAKNDQYVPIKRLKQLEKELHHAGKVVSCVFTDETGGNHHCQAGETHLAVKEIKTFLNDN